MGIETLNSDVPGRRLDRPGDQAQECCFSRTTLSQQADTLLALGTEGHVADYACFAQLFCQVAYLDHGFTE